MTEQLSVVYYALDATRTVQRLKIGYTGALRERMAALRGQTASGQVPLVLAVERGGADLEQRRHEQFADLRQYGEWFAYEGRLREFVAAMPHPVSVLLDDPELRVAVARNWPARENALVERWVSTVEHQHVTQPLTAGDAPPPVDF